MKLECIKHGETEGIRQENGCLACKKCLAEKAEQAAAQAKKQHDEAASNPDTTSVEDLFGNIFRGFGKDKRHKDI